MQIPLQVLILFSSLLVFLVVLELIRRGQVREEYSLVWLFGAAVVFILGLFRGTLQFVADLIEIEYAPSFIFMVGIALLMLTQLSQSVTVSSLTSKNRDLAQKLAILELRLRYHQTQVAPQLITTLSRLSLEQLYRLRDDLGESFDLQGFLRRTLELALECLNADSGSIIVFDDQGQLIEAVLTYEGRTVRFDVHELSDTVEHGLAGWVLENRQPALVNNTFTDSRWLKREWDDAETDSRSAISVPLTFRGRVAGVFTLVNHHARQLTENDLALLMAIAAVVSIAGADVLGSVAELPELEIPSDATVN